jgi:hypothetical protein
MLPARFPRCHQRVHPLSGCLVVWIIADAPTPFLVGLPTASLPAHVPEGVCTVDLDRGKVYKGVLYRTLTVTDCTQATVLLLLLLID